MVTRLSCAVTTKLNKITTTFQNKDLDTGNGYSAYNDDVKIIPVPKLVVKSAALMCPEKVEARIKFYEKEK